MITDEAGARAWIAAMPDVDAAGVDRLDTLVALLELENAQQNLVSANSLDAVWQRHLADSAQLLAHVSRETAGSWLDLGTGAGFPGLVVAALQPHRRVVLVESRARRIDWLERAAAALGLHHVRVVGARLETVEALSVDVISARAFAPLDRLIAMAARFSTSETQWVLPKGRSAAQDLAMLRGWIHTFHVEQSLTDPDAGVIVGTLHGPRAGRKGPKA